MARFFRHQSGRIFCDRERANRESQNETNNMKLSPGVPDLVDFNELKNSLDDPLFFSYLIEIFETVIANRSKEEADKIVRDFFSAEKVQTILETKDQFNVSQLCDILPKDMVQEFVPVLKNRVLEWKQSTTLSTIELLCELSPDVVVELYQHFLEFYDGYWQVPQALTNSINKLPKEMAAPLVSQYLNRIGGDAVRAISDGEILQVAEGWKLGIPERKGGFAGILERTPEDSEWLFGNLQQFFNNLYGKENPLSFLNFRHQEFDLSADVVELIAEMLIPEAPKQELIDLFSCYDRESFKNAMEDLIDSVADEQSEELLREAMAHGEVVGDEECFYQLLISIGTIVIQKYLKKELNLQKMSLADLFHLICLDWNPLPYYEQIVEKIVTFPKEEVYKQLKESTSSCWGDSCLNLIALMHDLAWPEFIPHLLDFMDEDENDPVREKAQEALIQIGEPIVAAIRSKWQDLDATQKDYASGAVSNVGGSEAIDFLVQIHDDEDRAPGSWAGDVAECPDPRFLELLELKMKTYKDDIELEESYYTMSVALNKTTEVTEQIREKFSKEETEEDEEFDISQLTNPEPRVIWLNLEMKCRNCGHNAHYRVLRVIVNRDYPELSPILGHDIPCGSCDTLNEFKCSESAKELVRQESERVKDLNDEQLQASSPLMFIQFDGVDPNTPVTDPQEQFLSDVKKHRKHPASWLGYGNFCFGVGQVRKAIDCYNSALKLDGKLVEATFTLAEIESKIGEEESAYRRLKEQWKNREKWDFFYVQGEENLVRFVDDYIAFHNRLREELGADEDPVLENPFSNFNPAFANPFDGGYEQQQHQEPVRSTQKAGRNDPCPCGSGKKFKKCCMNK